MVMFFRSCMRSFRKRFLKPKTIGIVPPGGYRRRDIQSKKAVEWMKWMETKIGRPITSADNYGEVTVQAGDKKYKVDGLAMKDNQWLVFEYHGC